MSDPGRNARIERIRQRRRDYRDAKARDQLAGCASLLTLLVGIFLIAGPFKIGADAGWWTLALTLPASGFLFWVLVKLWTRKNPWGR